MYLAVAVSSAACYRQRPFRSAVAHLDQFITVIMHATRIWYRTKGWRSCSNSWFRHAYWAANIANFIGRSVIARLAWRTYFIFGCNLCGLIGRVTRVADGLAFQLGTRSIEPNLTNIVVLCFVGILVEIRTCWAN